MFTWICPQCGREVPPSYNDCPDCAAKGKASAAGTEAAAIAPEAQPAPPPPMPQAAVVTPPLPPLRPTPPRGLPTWLMTILSALAFVGLGSGAFFALQYFQKDSAASTRATPAAEVPRATPSTPGAKPNPLMKQIEVAGFRLTQNKAKKTEARFLIVNHSGAELQDLTGTINLQARTAKKEEEPVGSLSFTVPALGAYEAKEVTAIVDTKLKVYELPDWQNLDQQLEITLR